MLSKLAALLRPRKDDETIRLGQQADRWLEDEALDTALAKLREDNYNAWRVASHPDSQERAWLMAHVIDQFVANLEALKINGQVVEKLQDMEQRKAARRTAPPYAAGL